MSCIWYKSDKMVLKKKKRAIKWIQSNALIINKKN